MPLRSSPTFFKSAFLAAWLLPAVLTLAFADEKPLALIEPLAEFRTPAIPEEWKQKLRDYVPNELRKIREEGNAASSAAWHKLKTRDDWEEFRADKLKRLRHSLGRSFADKFEEYINPTAEQKETLRWRPPQLAEPAKVAGTLKGDGYRIEKLLYRSAYGQWITANLYAPEPAREKMPGIIISHAHHTPKEQGELQDMGVLWARAGCYVLVPDHLGHGERRQHPFKSKDDFEKPFQVSRQDYYFRYDIHLQLNIVGETLMGCLAHDLMSGVSLLLDLPGIDKEKIIMLGAVAGGGDPCAVAAALDERVACAAPFNFGGPQPETKYPLPDDAETSFNYGGGGGWESTRNLAGSYDDGFLPWVIVGGIAPRRLIYGHEFSWDREHDPVWKRFEKIYGWYDKPDNLSFATGYGSIQVNNPPGSHCTHIGKTHRKKIHEALAKWFDIKLPGGEESTDRRDASELRCWTPELVVALKPQPLHVLLKAKWRTLKYRGWYSGGAAYANATIGWESEAVRIGPAKARQFILQPGDKDLTPLLLFEPDSAPKERRPGVFVITRANKDKFVSERADLIAELLAAGVSVALPDLYNTGLTGSGSDLGRRSSLTGRSSTLAMANRECAGPQQNDAYTALSWLEKNRQWDPQRVAIWGDSFVPPNPDDTNYLVPRDDDSQLPRGPDTLPQQISLRLAAWRKMEVVYLRGSVDTLGTALDHHLVLLPHDAIPLPIIRAVSAPDLSPTLALRQDDVVDCLNRRMLGTERVTSERDPQTAAKWILKQLNVESKK